MIKKLLFLLTEIEAFCKLLEVLMKSMNIYKNGGISYEEKNQVSTLGGTRGDSKCFF